MPDDQFKFLLDIHTHASYTSPSFSRPISPYISLSLSLPLSRPLSKRARSRESKVGLTRQKDSSASAAARWQRRKKGEKDGGGRWGRREALGRKLV